MATVQLDFTTLEMVLRRNPSAYIDEARTQSDRFESMCDMILLHNLTISDDITETDLTQIDLPEVFPRLVNFLVSVAPFLPQSSEEKVGLKLAEICENHDLLSRLNPENATSIVKAVISLHNNGSLPSEKTIPALFHLFVLPHKAIRLLVYFHIIKTFSKPRSKKRPTHKNRLKSRNNVKIKKIPAPGKKSLLRKFFAAQCQAENAVKAKKAIGILSELYRRGPWRDDETANVVANCVFGRNSSAVRKAAWFLLGENFSAEDDDLDATGGLAEIQKQRVKLERGMKKSSGRKLSKSERKIVKIKKKIKKIESSETGKVVETDFGPIRSLFDPQSFAEKLFRSLKGSRESFETKLLLMRLLSRVVSSHELVLGGYYSFLARYMQPHQQNVTRVLAYLVQSCHSNVPPTYLTPCVNQLATNFITDRNSPQAIVAGLNTMREMFARQPAIIDENLVKDIVSQHKKSKEKAISMSARGLISLIRSINPKLLPKKDRWRHKKSAADGAPLSEAEPEIAAADGGPLSEAAAGENASDGSDSDGDEKITPEFPVTKEDILGGEFLKKERFSSAADKNKERFRTRAKGGGTTNEDKKRKKHFVLTKHSAAVRERGKRSVAAKGKALGAHAQRMKMKCRRLYKRKAR